MVMSFDLLVALENKNRNSFLEEERKLNSSICHNDSAYLSDLTPEAAATE